MTSMYRGLSYNIIVCSPYIALPLHIYSSSLLAAPVSPPLGLALPIPLPSFPHGSGLGGGHPTRYVRAMGRRALVPSFVLITQEKGGLTW